MRIWGILIAAIAGLGLAGCAGADPGAVASSKAAADEAIFKDQWAEEFPGSKADSAIGVAKDICASFKAGTSFRDEVDNLVSMGASYDQAGAMIGMSTVTYCPEYKDRR